MNIGLIKISLVLTLIASFSGLAGCNSGSQFSALPPPPTLTAWTQVRDASSQLLLVAADGGPMLQPASQDIYLGQTPFATTLTSSFYLKNEGQRPAQNVKISLPAGVNQNLFQVTNKCGDTIAPGTAPCRVDLSFTPMGTNAFGDLSANLQINFTDGSDVRPPFNSSVRGTSLKEGSIRFKNASYTMTSPVAAGSTAGVMQIDLVFNGDFDTTKSFPPLNLGLGGLVNNLSFGNLLSVQAITPTPQSALLSSIGSLINQPNLVWAIDSTVRPGVVQCSDLISQSCTIFISFKPSFTSSVFSKNNAPTASNWQAFFSADVSLPYLPRDTKLLPSQLIARTNVKGVGNNGVNLAPLTVSSSTGIVYGTGPMGSNGATPGTVTGPFDASAKKIAIYPIANTGSAAGTVGLPIQITVTNVSGVSAENVRIAGLPPLISNPSAGASIASPYYYQDQTDYNSSDCINASKTIPASGCKIYMHFNPTPSNINFPADARAYANTAFTAPTLTINYDYATYQVTSGSAITPIVLSTISATAVKPAELALTDTATSATYNLSTTVTFSNSQPYYCTISDTSGSLKNFGGILTTPKPNTTAPIGNFSITSCTSALAPNAVCAVNGGYTPNTATLSSASVTWTYESGSTKVPSPAPITALFQNTAAPDATGSIGAGVSIQNIAYNVGNTYGASVCGGPNTTAMTLRFNVCGQNAVTFNPTIPTPLSSSTALSCTGAGNSGNQINGGRTGQTTCTFGVIAASPAASCTKGAVGSNVKTGILGENSSGYSITALFAPPASATVSGSLDLSGTPTKVGSTLSSPTTNGLTVTNNSDTFPIAFTVTKSGADLLSPASATALSTDLSSAPSGAYLLYPSTSTPMNFITFSPSTGGTITRNLAYTYTSVSTSLCSTACGATSGALTGSPSTIKFAGDSSVKVSLSSSSLIDFGTYYNVSASNPFQNAAKAPIVATLNILGSDTGWNTDWPTSITSSLPAWVSLDTSTSASTCLQKPAPVAVSGSQGSCTLSFNFNPSAIPAAYTTTAVPVTYRSIGSSSTTTAITGGPLSFRINPITPVPTLSTASPFNFGAVLFVPSTATGYNANFASNAPIPNALPGTLSTAFQNNARSSCKQVTLTNTSANDISGAPATLQTVTLTGGDSANYMTFTSAVGGLSAVSTACTPSLTLNPQSSCQLNVCYAPTLVSPKNTAQTANLSIGYSYTTGAGSQNGNHTSTLQGTGVQPSRVFAGGPWTLIVDGAGNGRVMGTNGSQTGNINTSDSGLIYADAAMGDSYYCRVTQPNAGSLKQVQCGTSPLDSALNGSQSLDSSGKLPVGLISLPEEPQNIAVGQDHACALTAGKHIYCWGQNSYGQLGIGSTSPVTANITQSVTIPGNDTPDQVTAGNGFSCTSASGSSGHVVRCWGAGGMGQLGTGTMIPASSGVIALQAPGLSVMGPSTSPLQTIPMGIASSSGSAGALPFNCVTAADGRVSCFGQNNVNTQYGLLGPQTYMAPKNSYGSTQADMQSLVAIPLPQSGPAPAAGTGPQVVIGENFACSLYAYLSALGGTQAVACWGSNSVGQLGPSISASFIGASSSDFSVSNLAMQGVLGDSPMGIAAGAKHACAVKSSNQVVCWGQYSGPANPVYKAQ